MENISHNKPAKVAISTLILIGIVIAAIFVTFQLTNGGPESYLENRYANYRDVTVSQVSIDRGQPYVRSTSWRAGSREDVGNSYGRIIDKDDDGLILIGISRIVISDADSTNGPYVGIYVEDLSDDVFRFFPKGVLKELPGENGQDKYNTDGIVWISSKYVSWTVALAPHLDAGP